MSEKRIWELLVRQFNKEISTEELKELQLLLQEQQDTSSYPDLLEEVRALSFKPTSDEKSRKVDSLSGILNAIRKENDPEQHPGPFSVYEVPRPDRGQKNRKRAWFFAVAACTITFIAGYFLLRGNKRSAEDPGQYETIFTRAGSKTLISLPDSSTVVLNSACKLAYNKTFGAGKREMQLSGEAYFDIRKSPEMPLIIHAGNVIIRVLGTTFNVRANPEDSFVEATLINGIIEVSLRSDPERKILLRPNEKIMIRKSDTLPAYKGIAPLHNNKDAVIAVTKVEPDPIDSSYVETTWTKDKMLFHKESFAFLARKMERWYNVKIILANPELNDWMFTGSLEKETLQDALRALQHLGRFNYTIVGQTVTITKK